MNQPQTTTNTGTVTLLDKALVREQFLRDGASWPLPAFDTETIARYRNHVLAEREKGLMQSDYRCKSQVLFPWMAEIATSDVVKHYVSAILGDDFHCWDTLFWIKEPGDGKVVSFHQDATYWNLAPKEDALTVWLAFNDVTVESGAIEYQLGSHYQGQFAHADLPTQENLLMRGQTIQTDLSEIRITHAELPEGHLTMHSSFIIHGSGANKSTQPRLACGMVFAKGSVRPIVEYALESTLWVSGEDTNNFLLHDPKPGNDTSENLRVWKQAYDRQHENYYKMQQTV